MTRQKGGNNNKNLVANDDRADEGMILTYCFQVTWPMYGMPRLLLMSLCLTFAMQGLTLNNKSSGENPTWFWAAQITTGNTSPAGTLSKRVPNLTGKGIANRLPFGMHPLRIRSLVRKKRSASSTPTQKPVELFVKSIVHHTNPGEYVYDPFAGSGTLMVACEKTNRRALMMELDPKYCDIIIQRYENYSGKKALREATDGQDDKTRHNPT